MLARACLLSAFHLVIFMLPIFVAYACRPCKDDRKRRSLLRGLLAGGLIGPPVSRRCGVCVATLLIL